MLNLVVLFTILKFLRCLLVVTGPCLYCVCGPTSSFCGERVDFNFFRLFDVTDWLCACCHRLQLKWIWLLQLRVILRTTFQWLSFQGVIKNLIYSSILIVSGYSIFLDLIRVYRLGSLIVIDLSLTIAFASTQALTWLLKVSLMTHAGLSLSCWPFFGWSLIVFMSHRILTHSWLRRLVCN